jgi:hypothetical protein
VFGTPSLFHETTNASISDLNFIQIEIANLFDNFDSLVMLKQKLVMGFQVRLRSDGEQFFSTSKSRMIFFIFFERLIENIPLLMLATGFACS